MEYIKYKDLKYYIFIDPLSDDKYTVQIHNNHTTFKKNNKEDITISLTLTIKDLENCKAYSTIFGKEFEPGEFEIIPDNFKIIEEKEEEKQKTPKKIINITTLDDILLASIEIDLINNNTSIINHQSCKVDIIDANN